MWLREGQRGPQHTPVWHWHYNRLAHALCGAMPPPAGVLTTAHVTPDEVNKKYRVCEKCQEIHDTPETS